MSISINLIPLQILHWITHYLKERGKYGLVVRHSRSTSSLLAHISGSNGTLCSVLKASCHVEGCMLASQAAMNNMTNELMLLGVATLLLLAFQKDIGRVCSKSSHHPCMHNL